MKAEERKAGHSEVRNAVITWLAKQAPGEEFFYADVADELEYQHGSVSAVVNSLMRAAHPVLAPGAKRGWYKVIGKVAGPPAPIAAAQKKTREAVSRLENRTPATTPSLPAPPRDVELMEVLGLLQDGGKMLRDENGDLWHAERM